MPKISIIVPVFNAEKYLEECLKSILQQTIKDFEIICIDDESNDTSIQIIKEYSDKDDRIKLYYQNHQGAGMARNKGMEYATGEYIAFIDADDYYYDSDALRKMVKECEKNSVYACGSFSKKNLKGEISDYNFWGEKKELLISKTLDYNCFQMDYGFTTFIYNRHFLVNNDIFFPKYFRYEDPVFIVKALHKINKFTMVDSYLYCCRISTSLSKYSYEIINDVLDGIQDNLRYAYDNQLSILFNRTVKRLEYELNSYILHNMKENDTYIIEKLIVINNLVRSFYKNQTYIIRPLHQILNVTINTVNNYERYLTKLICQNDNIIIYGAGKYGRIILDYLKSINQVNKVRFIMISGVVKDTLQINHIPVISIDDAKQWKMNSTLILVAVSGISQEIIINKLEKNKYMNYEILDDVFLNSVDKTLI